jgi:hypothetical protein
MLPARARSRHDEVVVSPPAQQPGDGDARAARDRLDLVVDVAIERSPADATVVALPARPVEIAGLPIEGPRAVVPEDEAPSAERNRKARDQSPEHRRIAGRVLVGDEMAVLAIDVQRVQLRLWRPLVAGAEHAMDLGEDAALLEVEAGHAKRAPRCQQLPAIANASIVARLAPDAEWGRVAPLHQPLSEVVPPPPLVRHDRDGLPVTKPQLDRRAELDGPAAAESRLQPAHTLRELGEAPARRSGLRLRPRSHSYVQVPSHPRGRTVPPTSGTATVHPSHGRSAEC